MAFGSDEGGFEELAPTQEAALHWLLDGRRRMLMWMGAVRAGKTIWSVFLFILLTVARGPGREYLIAGKTLGAIERNMRGYALAWCAWLGLAIKWPEGATRAEVAGCKWHLIGAPDVKAMEALQGGSISGELIDEVGLLPQGFVMQAMARTVADDGARIILTMNKLATKHWTRIEMVERATFWDAEVLDAELADNPGVSDRARGMARQRFGRSLARSNGSERMGRCNWARFSRLQRVFGGRWGSSRRRSRFRNGQPHSRSFSVGGW